jgi:phosphoribosylamine--glycine ligase
LIKELYVAPGNGGAAAEAIPVPIKDDDIPGLVAFAVENKIDLVVAGPELPLTLGLTDALAAKSIPCFGPSAFAAQLEGSKAFAKRIMREAGVPTADFQVFTEYAKAKAYLESVSLPIVLKADGLAAGKGVIVARSKQEMFEGLDQIMLDKAFGEAGATLVVEEALVGQEASFLAFCDGERVALLPSAQDHKPVGEGDTGPNTGGMGAYSPAPILPEKDYERVAELTIRPIVKRMAELGHPFKGILYAGLMIDRDKIRVLEYNVRFGDPECQPLLMRLDSDLAEIMLACIAGKLDPSKVVCRPETSICVVVAAPGYPGRYPKGMPVTGLAEADALEGVKVFQAGTKLENGRVLTSGGRVLGVTALGKDLAAAQAKAYEAVKLVHFEGCFYRRDIGDKGLE